MSIGLAFVKGLVGGFSKNIEREREARGADDARIAELENFVFEAATNPKKRVPKEIGNILQDAKQQVADREPIDLFGRAGDRLSLDMSKLQQMAMATEDDNLIKIGGYSFPGTAAYFETGVQKDDYARATQFWQSLQDHISNPQDLVAFRKHFDGKPDQKKFLNSVFDKNRRDLLNGYTLNNSPKGKDGEQKALVFTKLLREFGALDSIMDLYDGKDDSTLEANAISSAFAKFNKENKTMIDFFKKESLFFPYEKDGKLKAYPYSPTSKKERQIFDNLAKDYGYEGKTNQFLYDYATKIAPNKIFQGEIDAGSDTPSIQEAYGYLFHAVQLRKLNINDPLNIQKDQVMKYLNNNFGQGEKSDRKKIQAISIAMSAPARPGSELEQNDILTMGMPRQEELLSILDVKKKDFNEGFDAAIKARNKLRELLALREKIRLSDGLVEEMYKLGFGIFGTGGQLSQLAEQLSGSSDDSAEMFSNTLQRVFNKTSLDELGKIEALKIELAFTLARAADPSGRLSNQDFEVQLRRLGTTGIFTNIASQISAIETVLEDTENLVNKQSLIHDIYNKPSAGQFNVLSDKERRIIYAAKQYHKIKRETQLVGQPMSRGEFKRKATDINEEGNPKYISDPNNPDNVIDTDTLESVPRNQIQDGDKIT